MYDVVFIDGHGEEQVLAEHLDDRAEAGGIAREEAARRGVGRMMLTGSQKPRSCVCVIPVDGDGNGRIPPPGRASSV